MSFYIIYISILTSYHINVFLETVYVKIRMEHIKRSIDGEQT